MAGDAIGGLRKYLIDPAGLDPRQHGSEARPLGFGDPGRAGNRIVGEYVEDGPAFALAAFAADGDLILDRAAILKVAGEPGVDDGPHYRLSSVAPGRYRGRRPVARAL